jgi:zinc protease
MMPNYFSCSSRFNPVRSMRFLLIFLACAALAMTAHAGVQIDHWITPSGTRVYFVQARGLPMLDIQVDLAAGAAYDVPEKAGVASLTRGLLDAGAGGLNEEQLAERLLDTGARMGGGVSGDRASVALRSLSSKPEREAALGVLRAVLSAPTFPQDVLAREKQRSIAAIQEADTQPATIAAKRFAAAIYPDHPYGVSPTADTVAAITRQDLVDFYQQRYSAKQATISLIGDVSKAEAEAIAAQLSQALPAGAAGVSIAPLPPVVLPKAQVIKLPHSAAQSHVHIGLPAVRRGDPDYFALLVGNYTLGGGGFASRLMQEVREKRGYAYSVGSYFSPQLLPGPFDINLQTKRSQVDDAVKVVNDVLDRFIAQGPTEKELVAAKKNLVDGLALRTDSNAKLLGYLSTIGFYSLPLTYLDDFPARVNAVTNAQIRAAFARHVMREHLVTVIVAAD